MALISTLLISADPIMRRLLKDLVATADDFRLIAALEDAGTAPERVRSLKPDVILLDLDLSGASVYQGQIGQQILRQLSLITAAPILCLAASTQLGCQESAPVYMDGAALVIGKPSGVLSLDLIERRGGEILANMRRLAGGGG